MDPDDPTDAELGLIRRRLYRLAPDEFAAARRAEIASLDDDRLAKAVKTLRKPTLAAWVVNAHVHLHPADVDRLVDLGDRLRDAHRRLDAVALRTLSMDRRSLVTEIAGAALTGSGRASLSSAVRDDVRSTFDAAVADEGAARKLGALQRPQAWSGFGIAPADSPALTLLSGEAGRPDEAPPPADETTDPSRPSKRYTSAQESLARAETDLTTAQDAEDALAKQIRRLTTKLATLQHDLDRTRDELSAAKHVTSSARRARRTARSALDRVERESER